MKNEETLKQRGLSCWIEALILRQPTEYGEPPFPKEQQHVSDFAKQVLGIVSEFTTFEQITEMLAVDVHEQQFNQLQIKALLIVERIFTECDTELDPFHILQF